MSATEPDRWPAGVAALHGLGALAILALLSLGAFMTNADLDAATKFDLYQAHKTLGWLVLWLTLLRIAQRALTKAPRPLESHSPMARRAARAAQSALYALTLAAALTGWARVSSALIPIPIDVLGWMSAPSIAPTNAALSQALSWAHFVIVYALAALAAAHVGAALKHQFVDRDATLARILGRAAPFRAQRRT